jgi:acetate kinase
LPALPQVAVFDTAFHQTMPPRAYTYPVPLEWLEQHEVRRYGFHGTSHRYVAQQAQVMLGLAPDEGALLTAHLGNGCSATAVLNGRSVDTTMGLTPLEGLVMGTRSGSVDPALIGHVARATGATPESILDALNKRSGLLGLSGLSNDMRTLESRRGAGHARAQLAIEVFCYVLAQAARRPDRGLGRLDALVFTGGIGENSCSFARRSSACSASWAWYWTPRPTPAPSAATTAASPCPDVRPAGAGRAHQRRAHDRHRHRALLVA